MDEILKALANPLRCQILSWLRDPGQYFPHQHHDPSVGVCAGQIEARAGLSQSTVSAHLAVLSRAGLVTTRRVGQWVFYQRDEAAIQAFLQRLAREL
ncbi:ArsR/SmtB family transcription factor [Pseudomonas rhizoryzae]|uniref:ArsR/SmtB family transcription factor n=1 Tax=Pseudomonas rhizoryzae TaxID=2571129 RepID=UPI00073735C3|nr:metalloregulator ArsR/SmtB family transcription factor [Pseudomonas rhizoryzae]APQ13341.1 transcriptional regulator [Pseudomonas psychrotolerans]KTT01832.1 ArsR family transcriptional regulator [Pseudomonas psychrotolerans]KTT14115.1 ArsR family transcriptional regulator [Pseudomonas psychrotolerans]KTT23898.1 ArsR family transcriptional regulator [Pseudomonas psychrotolerans]KTT33355.1 ArsR family transcriptional regulator [Pseudomonas psychrotolerans]